MSAFRERGTLNRLFQQKMAVAGIAKDTRVAVACSGGPDSIALALLVNNYSSAMVTLTVDHGLRLESAQEALQVGAWLRRYNIAHTILKWEGIKPVSNIQEEARKARYQLMADYCQKKHIAYLLVAHTLDDQAETFMLRLGRGSGIDGLAAMAERKEIYGIEVVRPLLEVKKTMLVTYLKHCDQEYIQDPTNQNPHYTRVKVRTLLPELALLGLSVERLVKTARIMARASACLQAVTEDFLLAHSTLFPEGYAMLAKLPDAEEIALRVLKKLIMQIGVHTIPLRLDDLERLYKNITGNEKATTLGGCIVKPEGQGILVIREPKAMEKVTNYTIQNSDKNKIIQWDRFTFPSPLPMAIITALTQSGWLDIAARHALRNPYPDKKILYTLPCLRNTQQEIIAVPHLGIGEKIEVMFDREVH